MIGEIKSVVSKRKPIKKYKKVKKTFYLFFAIIIFIPTILNFFLVEPLHADIPYTPWGGGEVNLGTQSYPYSHTSNVDAEGSTFVAVYSDTTTIFVNKIDKFGNKVWGNGVVVFDTDLVSGSNRMSGPGNIPEVVTDGQGGAYVAWGATIMGPPFIYVQRISSEGTIMWQENGIKVANDPDTNYQQYSAIAPDSNGGLLITWSEWLLSDIDGNTIIKAQRIDSEGNYMWGDNAVIVSELGSSSKSPDLTSDSSGNSYISWIGYGAGNYKAQKLDPQGVPQWTTNGVTAIDTTNSPYTYALYDGIGGVYVTCAHCNQVGRINSEGASAFGTGVAIDSQIQSVRTSGGYDVSPAVVDKNGDLLFYGSSDSPAKVVVQKFNRADGTNAWDTTLTIPITAISDSMSAAVLDNNDIIVAWLDPSTNYSLTTQRINEDGGLVWSTAKTVMGNKQGVFATMQIGPDEVIVIGANNPSQYDISAQKVTSVYQALNLNSALDLLNSSGSSIKVNSQNGAFHIDTVKLKQNSDNKLIALLNINTYRNMNLATVSGSSDTSSGKALANIPIENGVSGYSLLVPVKVSTDNAVIVCPNATVLSAISSGCSDAVTVINGETKAVGSANITLFKVAIDGTDYWKLEGIVQGGAMSTEVEGAVVIVNPNNNSNNQNNNTSGNTNSSIDSDSDGIDDTKESQLGTDKNKPDTDGDKLKDGFEANNSGKLGSSTYLDPQKQDSNNNGILDDAEDFDDDGLTNLQEQINGTDPKDADTDGDGLMDGKELAFSTSLNPLSPTKGDTDNDGVKDGDEDFDLDGVTNIEEQKSGSNMNKVDSDTDGLTDKEEIAGCRLKEKSLLCSDVLFTPTNPFLQDTDSDGINDYDEAVNGIFDRKDYQNSSSYTGNIPISSSESLESGSVNVSLMTLAILIAFPFGYTLFRSIRDRHNIDTL